MMTAEAPGRVRAAVSVVAWVVARAGREEQVGVVVAAMALEAAAARDQGKLGQEAAAARARETRAVEVAEAAVAVVKVELVAQAQEKMGLVAAAGRAQAAPAAAAEAEMAPEPAWRPASARARPSASCWPSQPNGSFPAEGAAISSICSMVVITKRALDPAHCA